MARRAGGRLRQLVRDEYREQHRRIGWRYVPAVLFYVAVMSGFIVYAAWTMGPEVAWFMTGVGTGLSLLFLWIALHTDKAQRLESAALGEEWVAAELHKLRSAGWFAFNNIEIAGADVDHVAIGPGGIVVIETKTWSSPLTGTLTGSNRTAVARAEAQVRKYGTRIGWLLQQHGCSETVRGVMIVSCGPSRPSKVARTPGGVRVVSVDDLRTFLSDLPTILRDEQISDARSALQTWLDKSRTHQAATTTTRSLRPATI